MASLDDVITLPRLRESIGGVGDSEDPALTGFRSAAVSLVERKTARKIIDVAAHITDSRDCLYRHGYGIRDYLVFEVSDIKSDQDVTLRYSPLSADPSGKPIDSETLSPATEPRINLSNRRIVIYPEAGKTWLGEIRLGDPAPSLICARGMAAGDIPEEFPTAVILIVRALYEGTAYDSMGTNSSLDMLLSPHRPVFTGSIPDPGIQYRPGYR